MTHEVVAGLLLQDQTVLLCHRSAERTWYPNVWDLPGGHIEEGERPEVTLCRELEEELGISVALSAVSPTYAVSDTEEMRMTVYLVSDWLGDPVNQDTTEHDDIRWFQHSETRDLALAHPSLRGIIDRALNRR